MRLTLALVVIGWMSSLSVASAQTLPENELQIAINSYIDTFDVTVIYPSIAVTRRVGPSTSVSGRYLVDAITSASMTSRIPVDGITSATRRSSGGGDGLDELRHEFGASASQVVGEATLSSDVIYSTEHDYASLTVAASGTYSVAQRNTELQLSLVRAWDEVFPVTRDWRRKKNVTTWNAGVTQTLGPRAIAQAELSYSSLNGYLADAYHVVTIIDRDGLDFQRFEPRHPDTRICRAAGLRSNIKTTRDSALRLGYRYYWDSWDVTSTTLSGLFQYYLLGRELTLGAGLRTYTQSSAEFFEPSYDAPQTYMTVDSKLDSNRANEYQLRVRVAGELMSWFPGFDREGSELNLRASYYHRRTTTANWHSRRKTLDALVTSLAVRYRF